MSLFKTAACASTVLIVVTCCINGSIGVAVATCTSVSGVTSLGTSGSSYNCLVGVTCCINGSVGVAVAACTSVSGVTSLGTSGSSYNCLVGVLVSYCLTVELIIEALVGNLNGSYCGVGFIVSGTEPVFLSVDESNNCLLLGAVGEYAGTGSFILTVDVSLAVSSLCAYEIDVALCLAFKNVEVVAAFGSLKVYVNSCRSICGSVHIVAVHSTVKVVNLAVVKIALNHTELVCSANYRIYNRELGLGLGLGINAGIGSLTACGGVRGDPAVLDLGSVVHTDNTVNGNSIANYRLNCHCVISVSACCIIGAIYENGVTVAVGNYHVAVGSALNLSDNAGYVVLTCGVLFLNLAVTKLDSLCNSKSAVCSGIVNYGLLIGSLSLSEAGNHEACRELINACVISGEEGCLGNADSLECVVSTNCILNLYAILIDLNYKSVDCLIVYEYAVSGICKAYVLAPLTVRLFSGLCMNVKLRAIICGSVNLVALAYYLYIVVSSSLGIKSHSNILVILLVLVCSIESKVKLSLLHEELVSSALNRSCYDTLVIDNRESLVELNLCSVACSILNGSCKNVINSNVVLIGKINGEEAVLCACLNANCLNACSPGNVKGNAINLNECYYVVVILGRCVAVLVDVEEVIFCILNGRTLIVVVVLVYTGKTEITVSNTKVGKKIAACHSGYSKNEHEKKCENLFHLFAPLYKIILGN